MISNKFETHLWPIIFKALSNKKISYALTPNTFPANQKWNAQDYQEISIMLEDPDRPAKPGTAPPWSCWLTIRQSGDTARIGTDLYIYLARSIGFNVILSILEGTRGSKPVLTIEDLPPGGLHYCLHFEIVQPGHDHWELQERILRIDRMIHTLYILEADPENQKALNELIEKLKNF